MVALIQAPQQALLDFSEQLAATPSLMNLHRRQCRWEWASLALFEALPEVLLAELLDLPLAALFELSFEALLEVPWEEPFETPW
mmetsp:Transcript_160875/g.309000  ORF Transcript_160875/g.309000 Transcript_160875/m.309000 type:complete len:84 (+) Transcript_160875:885-1136(+)